MSDEHWPVETNQSMYVSCNLIDGEDGPRPLSGERVLDCAVSMVHVCVELQIRERKQKENI